jgi:hypothetical protein
MEEFVKLKVADESELLGEKQLKCHLVRDRPNMISPKFELRTLLWEAAINSLISSTAHLHHICTRMCNSVDIRKKAQ